MKLPFVILCFLSLASSTWAADKVERNCREFLSYLVRVHSVSDGTQVRFTGKFTPIPGALVQDLQRLYPSYTFRIANMTFTHWGPEPVHLLLVVDRRSGAVCSFLWDVWFDEAPIGFRTQFSTDDTSPEIARDRLAVLARLICFQMGWTAGDVTIEDGFAYAPLIDQDGEIRQLIRSPATRTLPAECLAFIRPGDKSKAPAP